MFKVALFLLSSFSLQAKLAPIDKYLGYLGELLEQKQVGDEHLLRMIAGAEQGQIINPVTKPEAALESSE